MAEPFDVIIIGAGHNGLVCAAYLARARKRVLVLERRHVLGGACVTEEAFPGCKVSTAAYVNSLFRPEIIRDLKLDEYGLKLLERSPSSFTPLPDGRYLLMGPEEGLNVREIARLSKKDASAYPKYEAMLERIAHVVEPTLLMTPPNLLRPGWRDLWTAVTLGRRFLALGPAMADAVDVLTGPAKRVLDRWFESDEVKATLATDAIIGAFAAPSTPGTAYVLFHHVMGETNGVRGVWAYVRGGMGGLSSALAAVAKDLGVEIRREAEVRRILVENGRAVGVELSGGKGHSADLVVSNADCHVTFRKLMDPHDVPADFLAAIDRIDYSSASLKINCLLSEVPEFDAWPERGPGPHHRGTIHVAPTMDFIERAYDEAKYGRPSTRPVLECTIPTVVDDTLAPAGKHLMSMFVQYAPYNLRNADGTSGDWDAEKERFADRCIDLLAEYAPNVRSAIEARQVLSPLDLERTWGLTGGNIFQGAMTLGQLFAFRPAIGWAGYRTPIDGLYLCGAATHPGGGVMGACGYNAAREILRARGGGA